MGGAEKGKTIMLELGAKDVRPWESRLRYLIEEVNSRIVEVGDYTRDTLRVTAQAVLRDRDRRAVYSLRVQGEPDWAVWTERIADIVGRARKVLDNAMWDALDVSQLTIKQQRAVYFPIVDKADEWERFESRPSARLLQAETREALRSIQPLTTGRRTVAFLHRANAADKHRDPLILSPGIDPQFLMDFSAITHGNAGSGSTRVDWVRPLPDVRNRAVLVEYRSENAILRAPELSVPIALGVVASRAWVDLQDLLWDVVEFVTRACGILHDRDTSLADYLGLQIAFEREQLDAFLQMGTTGDPLAELKWLAMVDAREERTEPRKWPSVS